jgi:hypothetical protein
VSTGADAAGDPFAAGSSGAVRFASELLRSLRKILTGPVIRANVIASCRSRTNHTHAVATAADRTSSLRLRCMVIGHLTMITRHVCTTRSAIG